MGLDLEPKRGDTQLSPEELDMLIPQHVTTRAQLDEVEQANIEEGMVWILSQRNITAEKLFSRGFQDKLHTKMLGQVWEWAGKTRTRETNIGVKPYLIEIDRKKLNDDAVVWYETTVITPKQLAITFHHRLIQIHCYPNGNGRHGRIMADLIVEKLYKMKRLEWVTKDMLHEGEARTIYIDAMKSADDNNYKPLFSLIK
tara:strand:- start:104 stop:700 length:597 start_codon:yes stop_codon:yes gene_type:complete